MKNDHPIVAIGCPISKNRVLLTYLEHIYNLDYPKNRIHLIFLVNNCTDNTYEILDTFRKYHNNEYREIDIWIVDKLKPGYIDGDRYKKRDYHAFAKIRNAWLSMISELDQYIFSVDSDILLPSYSLKRLLSHRKDIVSLLIYNQAGQYNILKERMFQNKYLGIHKFPRGLIEVGATGAAILISRNVIDEGVRYEYHSQGEDLGFCQNAKNNGFKIYCDTSLEAQHIMNSNEKKWNKHIPSREQQ
jgi:cellulose synthase/poly-beta-1,6-N-acetylglucosamine synthase-like glycosyltransferase